jgi:5-methylcytosine-specific restriction endonuclease McrA
MDDLNALCATCGLTKGAHRADHKVPDQCPEHEGWMDWPDVRVTTFRDSGERGEVENGTPSRRAGK